MSVDAHITAFLKQRMGLDAGSVGAATVERAVQQRMRSSGQTDTARYWDLLQTSPTEQQALIETVVVPETWFFRYPESFRALTSLAVKRHAGTGRPLRLLSAPCSSGEEPYSIAMALLDAGLLPAQFAIDAVDISQQLIARASTAHYGKNSFRSDYLQFRERHFSETKTGYSLNPRVREQVRLRVANLLEPASLGGEHVYDFVFCRNLLIYFDIPMQETALATLSRLVHKDGYLFVGPAEASLLSRLGLQAIGISQSFAFQPAAPKLAETHKPAPKRPVTGLVPPAATAPAARKVTAPKAMIAPLPPAVTAHNKLDAIAALANAGRTAEALRLCEQQLTQIGPSAPLFYWFGLLNDTAGKAAAAQEYYRKALYMDPQHPETLAQMAAVLQARGDTAGARRLQARAARGANKHG